MNFGVLTRLGQSIVDDFEALFPSYLPVASTSGFVTWLRDHGQARWFSHRTLLTLYLEYCILTERRPLSTRKLVNTVKDHGIETSRPPAKVVGGKLQRRIFYRVRPQKPNR